MSILTAATTIYCGLLYLTERMGDEMKIFLFVLMAIANAIFLISWLFGILEAYAILLSAKNPKIGKWLCFFFVKSKRFQAFSSELGVDMQPFNAKIGPENELSLSESFDYNITTDPQPPVNTPMNSIILENPKTGQNSISEPTTFRCHCNF